MQVHRFRLQTQDYGEVPVLRPIPTQQRVGGRVKVDPWGVLAPVRDKVPRLAALVPVVCGEVFSHAMHGYARPLMQVLGPSPKSLLTLTPFRLCALRNQCVMHYPKTCCPHKKMPECWMPEEVEMEAREASSLIVRTWAEGFYVIVVEGSEFSLSSSNPG